MGASYRSSKHALLIGEQCRGWALQMPGLHGGSVNAEQCYNADLDLGICWA
jgi:hypothetical protein